MSLRTLNLNPALYQYYRNHAFCEPAILAQVREYTVQKFADFAEMQISPEQGQFMQLLIRAMQATRILELGTFTGYSSLWMALGLPEEGKLITCDINADTTQIASQFWQTAGCAHKIVLKLGPALETLDQLITKKSPPFDFIFIDADKINYDSYYEKSLELLRSGGVIAIDNVLQDGKVADLSNQSPNVLALRQLNEKLLQDERIILNMLPISDGLTLAYKH